MLLPRSFLQFPEVPGIAAAMPRSAQVAVERLEAQFLVKGISRVHAAEGFEIAMGIAGPAGIFEDLEHQFLPKAVASQFGQEVHLLEFADMGLAAHEGAKTTAAQYFAIPFDDVHGGALVLISLVHVIDLGVHDGKPWTDGAELRHDGADDMGDLWVVYWLDLAENECLRHERDLGGRFRRKWNRGPALRL